MRSIFPKSLSYLFAFVACSVMALTSGCVSGGFKLTRQYAGFVNSQHVILRVLIYIFTGIIFFVTILVDMVYNNTVDFWDGKVSAGDYNFKGGEKTYYVRHEYLPGSKLRRSTINIKDLQEKHLQEIVLSETPAGDIELYIDGKLRTRVHGIAETPIVSLFDENGRHIEEKLVFTTSAYHPTSGL